MSKLEMTSHERIRRIYQHSEADRAPIVDLPWASTIKRWQTEGMPASADWAEYLGVDCVRKIGTDNSPRLPVQIIDQCDEYSTYTTPWGATKQDWHTTGAQGYLDYSITSRDAWLKAKQRMQPSRDRINWQYLQHNYPRWRERGDWISAGLWFGFEVTYSHMVGQELFLAMMDDPGWVLDMVDTMLDLSMELLQMVWDEGYHFDEVMWYNDMGFKNAQFMSVDMYRDLFKAADCRAAEWAHQKGCVVYYHSCGDINPLVPELLDVGVDMLNPLEVKAGMDPEQMKRHYGEDLSFHGGLNAVAYQQPEDMWGEMERLIPLMKENGGYIIGTDHSVPNSVSLDQYSEFVTRAKKLGSYE